MKKEVILISDPGLSSFPKESVVGQAGYVYPDKMRKSFHVGNHLNTVHFESDIVSRDSFTWRFIQMGYLE